MGEMNQVICIIETIALLALVLVGMAVLLGVITPGEALKRILGFLVVVLVAPALVAVLVQSIISPALTSLWAASKPVFQVIGIALVLLLFGRLVLELIERCSGGN